MNVYKKIKKEFDFLNKLGYEYEFYLGESLWVGPHFVVTVDCKKRRRNSYFLNLYITSLNKKYSLEELNNVLFRNNDLMEFYSCCSILSKIELLSFFMKKYIEILENLIK